MANFVSYANATELMQAVADKINALPSGIIPRPKSAFVNLPTVLTVGMLGYLYPVTDGFTTTALFVEGAGHTVDAGADVLVVDDSTTSYREVSPVGTENPSEEGWYELSGTDYAASGDTAVDSGKTYYSAAVSHNYKYDLFAGLVDLSGIEGDLEVIKATISAKVFDDEAVYSAGDIVWGTDGKLYKFTADHTAGDWNTDEVDEVTVIDLISAAEPDSLTVTQVNALIGLLD